MAIIVATGPIGLNMTTFDFGFVGDLDLGTHTGTALSFSDGGANNVTFAGTGLTYTVIGPFLADINSGTFTSLNVSLAGQTLSYSGWNISAVTFYDLVAAENWKALAALAVSGDDQIAGTAHKDVLISGAGTDTVIGLAGNDKLSGGLGNDNLAGGKGKDILTGGAGADNFIFDVKLDASFDTIKDFQHGVDHIWLDKSFFANVGPVGVLTAAHFHPGAAATGGLQGVIYDSATGFLWSDADGNGPLAAKVFAHVEPGLTLTASDFLIVG